MRNPFRCFNSSPEVIRVGDAGDVAPDAEGDRVEIRALRIAHLGEAVPLRSRQGLVPPDSAH